eukprot:CAMPEP_0195522640 /NCGR_PEP_ID=MMETSP0794_2-20130614/21003_1 /TAXON_ID=515487 /ORGANISM="Stephanopyxis turris, Strain CCMP 815" /LENGTH=312 /DNA_ID=CAMNT_0040652443 /DNA_START=88 /DNA_END=1026 /DNA_ORIENTATION=+
MASSAGNQILSKSVDCYKRLFVAIELPEILRVKICEYTAHTLIPRDVVLSVDDAHSCCRNSNSNSNTEHITEDCKDQSRRGAVEPSTNNPSSTYKSKASVRWVLNPSLYHCTLQFLGNVDETDIPTLHDALEEACQNVSPFKVSLGDIGCFPPSLDEARVIKFGLEPNDAIATVANTITDATFASGYKRDKRKYNAHITLGRVKQDRSNQQRDASSSPRESRKGNNRWRRNCPPVKLPDSLRECLLPKSSGNVHGNSQGDKDEANSFDFFPAEISSFEVRHIALVESCLSSTGATYITLQEYPLLGNRVGTQ